MLLANGLKVFGWQHVVYLVIFVAVFAALIVVTKLFIKTDKQKKIMLKVIAGLLLVAVVANRISIAIKDDMLVRLFPTSFCGTTSLVLGLAVLFGKPNNRVLHCCVYLALFGGTVTLIYPDFVVQSSTLFYLPTITGLLHHSLHLILAVLLLQTKWMTPELKKWSYLPIGMAFYVLYGLFLTNVFEQVNNAMLIYHPLLSGTPFYWYIMITFGTLYLLIFLTIWHFVAKKKHNKNNNQ